MTLIRESEGDALPSEVLQLTIPVQILRKGVETKRIRSEHSLNLPFIVENMSPNKIAELSVRGKRWVGIVPHGAYTDSLHIMLMRWVENEFAPDPPSVPTQEGEEIMPVMGDLAEQIGRILGGNEEMIWGHHTSTSSYNQEGGQSIPSMYHPFLFVPSRATHYAEYIPRKRLTPKERRSLRGGFYNLQFGKFLGDHALNGHFRGDSGLLNRLFDMDKAEAGFRGLRIPTRKSLEDILRTPGFFGDFLQPIARTMNQAAKDLSQALTDFDPDYVRERAKEAVINPNMSDQEREAILADITRMPNLLEAAVRTQNIQDLRVKGYSQELVDYLQRVSSRMLPASGPTTRWKRGFGYTLAIYQNNETGEGFLAINTIVENGPAGVIEGVLGAKLVRPPEPFSDEEMEIKMADYTRLVASLNGCVVRD